ncbi:hypothetical protein MPTK1_Vg00700 [Marchantia polymorpha subsp. ruderalis]|uniref:Uncharacterized protein n=1 Tax=Marchantia polymorpha TaxID=3197 RepID=A0A2R6VX68_MARPO|nr:hypothetical protein MARPO_YA0047 [Marchantia polymorpha]BBN20569.1 hypothetical protein Mp_Vg00700 [Marchantia polymorpha subsp. ruderalis]|eukprot:PTQ26194.1 hypothetical protein MARPO_YA0047 [Marchantia polymorpha]
MTLCNYYGWFRQGITKFLHLECVLFPFETCLLSSKHESTGHVCSAAVDLVVPRSDHLPVFASGIGRAVRKSKHDGCVVKLLGESSRSVLLLTH